LGSSLSRSGTHILQRAAQTEAAESTETRHQARAKVALNSAGSAADHKSRRDCTNTCETQQAACQHGQEFAKETCLGQARVRVDGERAASGHGQRLQAVNFLGRHVHQHGVFTAPARLELLGKPG
jgi:hypothetical protein